MKTATTTTTVTYNNAGVVVVVVIAVVNSFIDLTQPAIEWQALMRRVAAAATANCGHVDVFTY